MGMAGMGTAGVGMIFAGVDGGGIVGIGAASGGVAGMGVAASVCIEGWMLQTDKVKVAYQLLYGKQNNSSWIIPLLCNVLLFFSAASDEYASLKV